MWRCVSGNAFWGGYTYAYSSSRSVMKHGILGLFFQHAFPSVLTNTAKPEFLMHKMVCFILSFHFFFFIPGVLWHSHFSLCGIAEYLAYFGYSFELLLGYYWNMLRFTDQLCSFFFAFWLSDFCYYYEIGCFLRSLNPTPEHRLIPCFLLFFSMLSGVIRLWAGAGVFPHSHQIRERNTPWTGCQPDAGLASFTDTWVSVVFCALAGLILFHFKAQLSAEQNMCLSPGKQMERRVWLHVVHTHSSKGALCPGLAFGWKPTTCEEVNSPWKEEGETPPLTWKACVCM